jgi:hypothetical protein
MEDAFPLLRSAAAQCQKPGQESICFAIGWVAKKAHAIREIEAATYDKTCSSFRIFFQKRMRKNNAGQSIPVSQRKCRMPPRSRGVSKLPRVGSAAQEAEIGRDL